MNRWPQSVADLEGAQHELAAARPAPFVPAGATISIAGCFVCFTRDRWGPGVVGEPGWAAATIVSEGKLVEAVAIGGRAGFEYRPGALALREGPLLEQAVRALVGIPDVLIVNATGRDHPRSAGLAVHLGAILGIPTVGATRRPLIAVGDDPPDQRGARTPLEVRGEIVGCWVRTRAGARPIAVHAGWCTNTDIAVEVVLAATRRARTPEPLRRARRLARLTRAWCATD